MKLICTVFLSFFFVYGKAQKVDSIYIHLYTDSLKRGTYNYINVDGMLPGGRYIPLDSNTISFKASDGTFYGNSLYIEPGFAKEKITIHVVLKQNPALQKEFDMYIKKLENTERLKTSDEIMNEIRNTPASKHK